MRIQSQEHGFTAYDRVRDKLAHDRCVVLDGGVATELERYGPDGPGTDELWGTWALYRAPEAVLDVHRSYARTGCDVISTDTWSILSVPEANETGRLAEARHWMDLARSAVRLARQAVADAGRTGECTVAFAISEEANSPERRETLELLRRVLADDPPDLVLMETMTLIRDPATYETVELLLDTGFPVWLSFRRCRHGVCGVQGQHWGPPEGDLFGRAARRFEEMGVGALLINCLPVEHVAGMIPWLRDFTSLPLGVYPNLGVFTGREWRFDDDVDPAEYAALAHEWREEGAQIIGGCCGVTPDHIERLVVELEGTRPGMRRSPEATQAFAEPSAAATAARPWLDERGRRLYPLPFPELVVDPGVFVPTIGSYLVWKTLFATDAGRDLRCLDVGCGCGILAVQLALNAAAHVHAIDIDRDAVANTLANAFRNGVSERVSGDAVDFYHWAPHDRFELVVASLYQMPVDPYEEPTGHRPLDFWGRSLVDHFIRLLPNVLTPDGVAYLMQLSIIGQGRTEALLAENDLVARVADYSFFPFDELFVQNRDQIARVERLSDAYHLHVADEDVLVAYLLEIRRTDG